MGSTCKPMAVSFQCMTKSTTNLKNFFKKFKKKNWEKKGCGTSLRLKKGENENYAK